MKNFNALIPSNHLLSSVFDAKTTCLYRYGYLPCVEIPVGSTLLLRYQPKSGFFNMLIHLIHPMKNLLQTFTSRSVVEWKRLCGWDHIGYSAYGIVLRNESTESLLFDIKTNVGGIVETYSYEAYISYQVVDPEKLVTSTELAAPDDNLKNRLRRCLIKIIHSELCQTADPSIMMDTDLDEVFLNEIHDVYGIDIFKTRIQYVK